MPLAPESEKSPDSITGKIKAINDENGNVSKGCIFWKQGIINRMPSIYTAQCLGYLIAAILILSGRQGWISFPHEEVTIAWHIFCLYYQVKDFVKYHSKSLNKTEQKPPTLSGEQKGGSECATSELKFSEEDSLLNCLRSTGQTDNTSVLSENQQLRSRHSTQTSAVAGPELREPRREESDGRNKTGSCELENYIYAQDICPRWFLGSETYTFLFIYAIIVFKRIVLNVEDPASFFNIFIYVIALLDVFEWSIDRG